MLDLQFPSLLINIEWTLYEQVAIAAMDYQRLDVAKEYIKVLQGQFHESKGVGAIEWLNKYLEIFMADHDAWRELAEVYVSLQMYKQAAFCYEELLLSHPTIPLYHLSYADVSSLYDFIH
ncbi:hypothetical protein SASPL_148723 [Salvia splendens]|uniref:ER membrane protein complex subunit 2 n=1 Tax=Salvia splendens TaxID=180675 RepID=A0A8X8Z4L6_SALSN|nr:hypothetical protein SASPL_148723 [Salvia splendens]